ncbi:MAG: hypothetical protein V1911_02365 [Candidatus Micrarchaeota archaeon]
MGASRKRFTRYVVGEARKQFASGITKEEAVPIIAKAIGASEYTVRRRLNIPTERRRKVKYNKMREAGTLPERKRTRKPKIKPLPISERIEQEIPRGTVATLADGRKIDVNIFANVLFKNVGTVPLMRLSLKDKAVLSKKHPVIGDIIAQKEAQIEKDRARVKINAEKSVKAVERKRNIRSLSADQRGGKYPYYKFFRVIHE